MGFGENPPFFCGARSHPPRVGQDAHRHAHDRRVSRPGTLKRRYAIASIALRSPHVVLRERLFSCTRRAQPMIPVTARRAAAGFVMLAASLEGPCPAKAFLC